jgi:hypothetical protein
LTSFVAWLQGKKTILVGVVVLALTALGFWYGKLNPAQALQLISVAAFALGLGGKLQRYLPQILIGLQGLAEAIADLKAAKPLEAGQVIAASAETILPEVAQLTSVETTGLHVTGDPQHVSAILAAATKQSLPVSGGAA